jgi:hypothetical protein
MSQPPPASGDRARSRPAFSPLNPIASRVQDVRVERDGSKACRLPTSDPDAGVWGAGGVRLDGKCKQLAAVTREAFAIVKTLGETEAAI